MNNMRTNSLFKNILGITFIAAATLTSCNKNDNNEITPFAIETPLPDGEVLKEAFLSNRDEAMQTNSIDGAAGGSIIGEQGTEIIFNPNAFLDADNNLVTGNVTIELIEVYSKSDMLLMNMPTNGKRPNGDIETLISGGEFFVNATQDGENLQPNGGFTIIAPAANNEFDNDMKIFKGTDEDHDDAFTWVEDEQNGLEPRDGIGASGGPAIGYSAFVNQFGWTNIDKWYSDPRPKTTIFVDLPEGYDNTNCAVYVSYDGEPTALAPMDRWISETELLTEHYGLIPIGLEVHFILISQVEDEWNYAVHQVTIQDDHIECFCDPNEINGISEDDLIDIINNLP